MELDSDVQPYLAALMVATLVWVHETLTIPDTLQLRRVSMEAFQNMLQAEVGKVYDNYGAISLSLLDAAAKGLPVEVESRQRECLERRMDQVVDLVSWMVEVVGMTDNDQDSVNMETNVQQLLAGASGACMA